MSTAAGCTACGVPIGEHRVDEWLACSGRSLDLPYEDVGGDPPVIEADGRPVADNVVVRAGTFEDGSLGVGVVLFDFSIGHPDHPPTPVANVMFVGTAWTLRKVGVLIRDACNGAANRIEDRR